MLAILIIKVNGREVHLGCTDVAKHLGISVSSVRRCIAMGYDAPHKFAHIRYVLEAVEFGKEFLPLAWCHGDKKERMKK